jgi:hypothetical protein
VVGNPPLPDPLVGDQPARDFTELPSAGTGDAMPHDSAPSPAEWLSDAVLAAHGVAIPQALDGCVGCVSGEGPLARALFFDGASIGSISGGGGGAAGGGITVPGTADSGAAALVELTPPPGNTPGTGSSGPAPDTNGDQGGKPPRGDGPSLQGQPVDPAGPNQPGGPGDPVSVPEPSAILLASFSAAGYVIRQHRLSRHRG